MTWGWRVPWAGWTAVILFLANWGLIGLPGALSVAPTAALLGLFGVKAPGDASWPIMLWAGTIAPVGLLVAVNRAAKRRPKASTDQLIAWSLIGYFATGILIAASLLIAAAAEDAHRRARVASGHHPSSMTLGVQS